MTGKLQLDLNALALFLFSFQSFTPYVITNNRTTLWIFRDPEGINLSFVIPDAKWFGVVQ